MGNQTPTKTIFPTGEDHPLSCKMGNCDNEDGAVHVGRLNLVSSVKVTMIYIYIREGVITTICACWIYC